MDAAPTCELCEAARLTEWYHEDDECWVAECEACFVPMVVWRRHAPDPPDEVKARLLARLDDVAGAMWPAADGRSGYVVDDVLRTIPDHYHAHARPRRWGPGGRRGGGRGA